VGWKIEIGNTSLRLHWMLRPNQLIAISYPGGFKVVFELVRIHITQFQDHKLDTLPFIPLIS